MAASGPGIPRRRGFSVAGPAILIGLGVVLLLNSLDILPWSLWGSLWRFWPLVLILAGVEIILGRTGVGRAISLAAAAGPGVEGGCLQCGYPVAPGRRVARS